MARLSSGALHRHDLSVAVPFGVQAGVAVQRNDGLTTPSPRGACLVIRRALLGAVACRAPPPTLSLSVCPPIELYRRSPHSLLTSRLDPYLFVHAEEFLSLLSGCVVGLSLLVKFQELPFQHKRNVLRARPVRHARGTLSLKFDPSSAACGTAAAIMSVRDLCFFA